jgi:spermidine synthase
MAFLKYFKDSSALMLVPTLLLGMNFPILIKLASGGHEHVGRGTGLIYSANTLGAIMGSLVAGFGLLPFLGTEASLVGVATLNLLMVPLLFRAGEGGSVTSRKLVPLGMVGLILAVTLMIPKDLLKPFFMRDSAGSRDESKLLFYEEGLTDTVAVFEDNYGILDPEAKRLITNGISMSASNVIATRYMKLFAHVPILLSDHPEQVLVICFGTGQTTGAAGIHGRVQQVDSLDLSSSVIHAGPQFKKENHDVLNNPKVNIVLQDGRNHLLTTQKQYDVITGEPPPPRTAFTVNLYTQDFYEQAKKRLKPGGIIAQWVPLHSQSASEVDMHFKTFLSVFPHAIAWMSVANEILLIGSDQPIEIDFLKLRERLKEPAVKEALAAIHINSAASLLANIWFLEDEMHRLSEDQPIITDNRPLIEFYLNYPDVIGTAGLERLVFNRTPAETIWKRIKNMEYSDWKVFERYYQMMDRYQRGVMYANRGLLLEAIALGDDDDLFRYHLQAGRQQVDGLLRAFKENPKDLGILLNLGHAYYQIGEYEKSTQMLRQVLAEEPEQGMANLYLGYNLLELGQLEEAKQVLQTAVKKDPRQLRSVMQQVALIELLMKLEKDPESTDLLNAVAQFYNIKNEFRKSLNYSLKVLEKDPMDKQALQSAVFSYRGLGEPGEVIGYGVRYDMADPEDMHFQYIMAEMYIQTLRCEKALPYLKSILKKDDTYQNARQWLKKCESKLGKKPSA